MKTHEYVELLNSHLPSKAKSKFEIYEDEGDTFLKSSSGDIKIFLDTADDEVTGATLITTGVPFYGITAEELFEHTANTLISIIALIQANRAPNNFKDYSGSKTIAQILGLLDKTHTGALDKSYHKDGIRYVTKTVPTTGLISFSVYRKRLDNLN